ncbi:uncharacterized protein LOC129589617 [Paramacrobiotus metropolitanus]|uniref:uncharacterized protein LOC129589617 n=1 Tax=Paramacrobiotus metropolitanus TaxID=2943436 RepID=UPI0024461AD7|nr:uncharacterized protein LOC129589617 [Paramacrobiotus metropolitanus]XP_055340410.1 uncharacterized protein LOC129589617 [Paramacrobiotus metropolitanus]
MTSSCSHSPAKSVNGLWREVGTNIDILADCVKSASQYVDHIKSKTPIPEIVIHCLEAVNALMTGTTGTQRFSPDVEELLKQSAAEQERHFANMLQLAQNEFADAAAQISTWKSKAAAAFHGAIGAADSLRALGFAQHEGLRIQTVELYPKFMECADNAASHQEARLATELEKVLLVEHSFQALNWRCADRWKKASNMASSCSLSPGSGVPVLFQELTTNVAVLYDCVKAIDDYSDHKKVKIASTKSFVVEMSACLEAFQDAINAGTTGTLRIPPDMEELVTQTAADQERHFADIRQRAQHEFTGATQQISMWKSKAAGASSAAMGAADSLGALSVPVPEDLRFAIVGLHEQLKGYADKARSQEEDFLSTELKKADLVMAYVNLVKSFQADN